MAGSILIVASSAEQRESLATPLRAGGYSVAVAHDGSEAIRTLHSSPVDTVLILGSGTDPGANKLRVRLLQERRAGRVILLTQFSSMKDGSRVSSYGLDNYQMNERELLGFLSTNLTATEHASDTEADNAVESLVQTIDVLIGLQELGNRHFGGTSHRVTLLAHAIAEEMSFDREMTRELVLAALLRDIGKAGLDQTLLREDGAFSPEQVAGMKEHVGSGIRLLEHIEYPWKVLPILRHHHERYDGMGYPDGLRGPEIPLGARILAAVDSYVALISGRSYKSSVSPDEAFDELQRNAGTQFDPEIVEVLIRVAEKRTAAVASNQKPKVLITGSDLDFARPLEFRLLNLGMQVLTVPSLEEAVLKVIEDPPHLVLAEVGSDEERSFHLLQQIREDADLRHLPFVLVSSNDNRVLKVRALREGVDDFLVKSDNLDELVARIENILSREAFRRSDHVVQRRRGISGEIENLSLPDIFQMLNLGLKTACVSLTCGESSGQIWLQSGAAVHAELGSKAGVDAVYEMLRWKTGGFSIAHGVTCDEETIEMDTMLMVMEGLRMIDEAAAHLAATPT